VHNIRKMFAVPYLHKYIINKSHWRVSCNKMIRMYVNVMRNDVIITVHIFMTSEIVRDISWKSRSFYLLRLMWNWFEISMLKNLLQVAWKSNDKLISLNGMSDRQIYEIMCHTCTHCCVVSELYSDQAKVLKIKNHTHAHVQTRILYAIYTFK